jgi:replicative superfamily II helicase
MIFMGSAYKTWGSPVVIISISSHGTHDHRKKVVFLFPYKALVNEKFDQFTRIYGEGMGMRIIRCTGDYLDQTSAFVRGKYDLAVLTYEMFLSLSVSNSAVLNTIGLVVVDETQFISDSKRGIVVELLLTNILAAKERGVTSQIVTLSAVIGGENSFDEWLGASKLITQTRPVPLIEGVIDRTGVYRFVDENGQAKSEQLIPRMSIVQRRDKPSSQDIIVPLVKQLLEANADERIIIFRNNRGSAEGCAKYLADGLGLSAATIAASVLPSRDLSTSSQSLRECLQGGTAFHNSNLNRDERLVVEQSYRLRDGNIRVLAATTTVAAGINTPASTVILAEHEFFGDEESRRQFTVAEYKNMAGRAGRLGYHEVGRSILLAQTPTEAHSLYRDYVLGTLKPLSSSFSSTNIETWVLRLLSQVKKIPKVILPIFRWRAVHKSVVASLEHFGTEIA